MTTPSNENVILGKGALFFDRYDAAGASTGFRHLGNCSVFEIGTEDDVLELKSSLSAAAGTYKKVTRSRTVNINVTFYEFDSENLALALMGEVATFTQTGATVADEVLVAAALTNIKGKYFFTAQRRISAVTLTQTGALVAGTDYEIVDAEQGLIRILPTSATVVDGTAITIDYTSAAVTALDVVRGATKSLIEGKLRFVPDPMTGPKLEVEVFNVSFNPQGVLGLIQDDWGTGQLQGVAQDDSGGAHGGSNASPYYNIIKRAA